METAARDDPADAPHNPIEGSFVSDAMDANILSLRTDRSRRDVR